MKFNELKQKIKKFPVFSSNFLKMPRSKENTLKVQLSGWKKNGLILQLRKGLYLLSKEERQIEPTHFYLANQIFLPSYISMESALAFYGLIPEFVGATTSITSRKTCKFKNEFGIFTYQHIKKEGYDGFVSITENYNLSVLIATPEKALVDFIYLNLDKFKPDNRSIFLESCRFQNFDNLNKRKLRAYGKSFKSNKLLLVIELFIREVTR